MKKIFIGGVLSLFLLSGCGTENPDKENFEIQHQEPNMEEAEQKLFDENPADSTYEVMRSSSEVQ